MQSCVLGAKLKPLLQGSELSQITEGLAEAREAEEELWQKAGLAVTAA